MPELNDTADITERISQARKLKAIQFNEPTSAKQQKDPDRYTSQAL
jgi:hypothetical protein